MCYSSEWDEPAKETYFRNYEEVPFGDITIPETKALIPDKFDVLCAGFPCQPFSNAGLKKGIEDTRGTLFYHIAEILRDHQPKAVLLENVRGLISNDKGKTIQTVLRTITGMGYTCNVPQELIDNGSVSKLKEECAKMVLCAKDHGVPQNRPRIYIVLWKKKIWILKNFYIQRRKTRKQKFHPFSKKMFLSHLQFWINCGQDIKEESWNMKKKKMDSDIAYSMEIQNTQVLYREGITKMVAKY